MRRLAFAGALALVQLFASPVAAQVETVAAAQIPAGNSFGPLTPSGFFNLGNDIWFGDEAQGLRHYVPLGADPDPLSDQQFKFDINPDFSVGGGTDCIPFCGVGQVAVVGPTSGGLGTAVLGVTSIALAVWDHPKGQPFQIGGGGVYLLGLGAVQGCPPTLCPPIGELETLAPGKLPGNQPTAVAYGPDGKLYVGFLKSPGYVRITNVLQDNHLQTVESVGTALNGKPIFGMSFYGSDLYLVTGDGFYVVGNVVSCQGNANNCGAPKLIWNCAGPCNAIAPDGKGNLYFAQNAGGAIFRYTPASVGLAPVAIASGFKFAAGHTNGLGIDRDGNLWIGDNPAPDGFPNGGRLSRIPADALPN